MHKLAIIIEWENILTAEADRVVQMLKILDQQIGDINAQRVPETYQAFLKSFANSIDTVIVHGPDVKPEQIEEILDLAIDKRQAEYRIISHPKSEYYLLKNIGVENTHSEYVAFIDSDVIPDENWLNELLSSFNNEKIQIVGGWSYITTESAYSKAYACGMWLWPLRSTTPKIFPYTWFFANNYAMTRQLAEQYPYVTKDSEKRIAGKRLALKLLDNNIPIYRNTGAQCSHPPPYGCGEFFARSFLYGKDFISDDISTNGRSLNALLKSLRRYFKLQWFSMKNLVLRRKALNMKWYESLLSLIVMTTFNLVQLMGELCVIAAPEYFIGAKPPPKA